MLHNVSSLCIHTLDGCDDCDQSNSGVLISMLLTSGHWNFHRDQSRFSFGLVTVACSHKFAIYS